MSSNGRSANELQVATKSQVRPHLQSLERVLSWPVVSSTLDVTNTVYYKIKGSTRITNFFLDKAEGIASFYLNSIVLPVASVFRLPIEVADGLLTYGVIAVEKTLPCCIKCRTDKVAYATADCLTNNICVNTASTCIHKVKTCTGDAANKVLSICDSNESSKVAPITKLD